MYLDEQDQSDAEEVDAVLAQSRKLGIVFWVVVLAVTLYAAVTR
jgi:hypothetical protein